MQQSRIGTKLSALHERSAVNAATLETTETDLSAELKDVLSKVQPKVRNFTTDNFMSMGRHAVHKGALLILLCSFVHLETIYKGSV